MVVIGSVQDERILGTAEHGGSGGEDQCEFEDVVRREQILGMRPP